MPELTADQATEKLRGLGWDVYLYRMMPKTWSALKLGEAHFRFYTDAELIALAKSKGWKADE